ncbi:MAG: hypothetical protein R3E34_02295 [Rhodocyclaceae bacterium]
MTTRSKVLIFWTLLGLFAVAPLILGSISIGAEKLGIFHKHEIWLAMAWAPFLIFYTVPISVVIGIIGAIVSAVALNRSSRVDRDKK